MNGYYLIDNYAECVAQYQYTSMCKTNKQCIQTCPTDYYFPVSKTNTIYYGFTYSPDTALPQGGTAKHRQ